MAGTTLMHWLSFMTGNASQLTNTNMCVCARLSACVCGAGRGARALKAPLCSLPGPTPPPLHPPPTHALPATPHPPAPRPPATPHPPAPRPPASTRMLPMRRYLTQPVGEDGNRYSFLNAVLLAWLVRRPRVPDSRTLPRAACSSPLSSLTSPPPLPLLGPRFCACAPRDHPLAPRPATCRPPPTPPQHSPPHTPYPPSLPGRWGWPTTSSPPPPAGCAPCSSTQLLTWLGALCTRWRPSPTRCGWVVCGGAWGWEEEKGGGGGQVLRLLGPLTPPACSPAARPGCLLLACASGPTVTLLPFCECRATAVGATRGCRCSSHLLEHCSVPG